MIPEFFAEQGYASDIFSIGLHFDADFPCFDCLNQIKYADLGKQVSVHVSAVVGYPECLQ